MHKIFKWGIKTSFYEIQRINDETYVESSGFDTNELVKVKRTNYIIYTLISNKYATLKELRDDYTIEEVLDLYEICMTNMYNKQMLLDERSNSNGWVCKNT